ncbi:hypothetical protein WD019_02400 [Fictibacillus sp. Mic-4]|uniref:hypothetical protein n=1 Tax=Fictibacillus sp. Mic-4 TaxID=3132826 RepID=UPI003CF52199
MTKGEITKKISETGLDVINVVNVWSNGKKIRRFAGQDDKSTWHNPKDGYRRMVAVLIDVKEAE